MSYQIPYQDMMFLINDVFKFEQRFAGIDDFAEFDKDLYGAILEEAGKFATGVLQPINQSGDEEACQFKDTVVTTPKGFKEAYQAFVDGGWQSLTASPEYGGQGLPKALHVLVEEAFYSTNTSFCLYGSLTAGAYHLLQAHASQTIKATYLPKMISGEWSGSMCLTEAHAGSDLGLLKSKAEPQVDGTYHISGSKIFITGGEHDMTDNIIHLVLARLPDAPAGPKGISLFLVPKFKLNADGSLGERNGVTCGSIEHKMGIKASSTCVMNFDHAEGYLIGGEHQGLRCMFTMMNLERLSIGIQGIGLGEMAYQQANDYAHDRLQGRAKGCEGTAPIIKHGDVQRMLNTMQAFNQAGRALAVWLGSYLDIAHYSQNPEQMTQANQMAALLTPIAKAFFTDMGYEVCTIGQQCFGGHGYVKEWGMEQHVRDARIAQIYEGTNGIQALDLVGRKVVANDGVFVANLLDVIREDIDGFKDNTNKQLVSEKLDEYEELTRLLVDKAQDPDSQQQIACDYLHYSALVIYAYLWLKMSQNPEKVSEIFAENKRFLADFYYARLLPRSLGLKNSIENALKV